MSEIKWTDEQLDVIKSVDNNTLVSASAGSGKTAVMLERLMRIVVGDKEQGRKPVRIRRIVTVTFNESVTAELKSKINNELVKLINSGVCSNDYLREQIEDLPLAEISTLHAFCSNLIKTNFDYLDVDASFSIADDSERQMLFGKAITNVMKGFKSKYDPEIDVLISYCRGEREFYGIIEKIYSFLEAQLDREGYLSKTFFESYEGQFCDTPIAKEYMSAVRDNCIDLLAEGNKKLDFFNQYSMDKRAEHIQRSLDFLTAILNAEDFKDLCRVINFASIEFPRIPFSKKDDFDQEIGAEYKNYNDRYKDFVNSIKLKLGEGYDEIQRLAEKNGLYLKRLAEVVRSVADEYARLKKRDNKLDFADLEYYAVKLLQNDEMAKEISSKYDYICVDEYQDINAVQEYIITRLSNGKNLFMVGDVKQSIYQFRMTDPEIFLGKFRRYQDDATEGSPFSLNSNYRSCKEVIDFVNDIFDVIMTQKSGGIDYRRESRLQLGNKEYEAQDDQPIRIATFSKSKEDLTVPLGEDKVYSVKDSVLLENKSEYEEGVYIAREILRLVQNSQIQVKSSDGKMQYRKVRFGDIALLCSKRSDGVEKIVNVLKSVGIPVDGSNIVNEKSNPSIELIIDFIKVLDNHHNDIPLVAVLTSKILGGFSYSDMATVKKAYRDEKFFYNAILRYSREKKDPIAEKLKEFFAMLSKYRFASGFMSVSELIRRIIIDFDYETYLNTLEDGRAEFMGLEQFVGMLEEKAYNSSVARFAAAVDNIEDFGKVAGETGLQGDYVRTSTIHASKGLEYPVVFIVDSAKQVNTMDATHSLVMCDKRFGMAIKNINEEDRSYDNSLQMNLLKDIKVKEFVEEYMRLFYVAVTRARNRLYITATTSNVFAEKIIKSPKSMWDWLNNIAVQYDDFRQKYTAVAEESEREEMESSEHVLTQKAPDKKALAAYTDFFDREYKDIDATVTPVKYTVTAVNNMAYENTYSVKKAPKVENVKNYIEDLADEIKDNSESDDDMRLYADEGIAYHRVMECIDFDCYTVKDVESRLDDMVEKQLLTKEQRTFIRPQAILDCLRNDIISQAGKYPHYREKQFMLNIPSDEIVGGNVKDKVLLQGTIDLFINGKDKGGENILVDFKFSKKKVEDIAKRYKRQLELYAMAVEECMNVKVDKKVIFVLGQNKTVIL